MLQLSQNDINDLTIECKKLFTKANIKESVQEQLIEKNIQFFNQFLNKLDDICISLSITKCNALITWLFDYVKSHSATKIALGITPEQDLQISSQSLSELSEMTWLNEIYEFSQYIFKVCFLEQLRIGFSTEDINELKRSLDTFKNYFDEMHASNDAKLIEESVKTFENFMANENNQILLQQGFQKFVSNEVEKQYQYEKEQAASDPEMLKLDKLCDEFEEAMNDLKAVAAEELSMVFSEDSESDEDNDASYKEEIIAEVTELNLKQLKNSLDINDNGPIRDNRFFKAYKENLIATKTCESINLNP